MEGTATMVVNVELAATVAMVEVARVAVDLQVTADTARIVTTTESIEIKIP